MDQQQVRHAMANIIADPQFVSSGNAQADLQRAYQIAVGQQQQRSSIDNWAIGQLQQIEKADPQLAISVCDVFQGKDPAFAKHAAHIADPVGRFHAAWAWAKQRAQSTRRSVAKATKALPVRSSSGASPNGGGGKDGMDAAISRAMAGKY